MPNTEFWNQTTGSNLNAGSTRTDAASFTYASGNWVQSTGVFTVASGDPLADGVAVGDWASVYADGASVTGFVGRVTARTSTTITVSLTAKSGTAPTDGTGDRTLKIGGAWAGPNGASMFPYGFIQNTMTNASGHVPRINFLSGTDYEITAGTTHSNAGPVIWAGYRALLSGVTAEADDDIFTATSHGFVTGDVAMLESGTGFTGIVAEREYYVIRIDDDTYRLANTWIEAVFNGYAAFGEVIDVTVDGSSGVVRAPSFRSKAKVTGDDETLPFIMLIISGTRHEFKYLEFANNGWDDDANESGNHMVQSTSGGTSLLFYRVTFSDSWRDGLRSGGAGGLQIECEGNGCNRDAANTYGQFNTVVATTYRRCTAHHSFKEGDAGAPGFCFQAGTGLRVIYEECIAAHNGGQGFWNVTGNAVASFVKCVAYANGLSGWDLRGATGDQMTFENCIAALNGEAGWRWLNAGWGALGWNNADYGNVDGAFTNGIPAWFQGHKTLTADPFVDGANGNFALNNTAGGGAECRGMGIGMFHLSGTPANGEGPYSDTTESYPDIGPTQHLEDIVTPGGPIRIMRSGGCAMMPVY